MNQNTAKQEAEIEVKEIRIHSETGELVINTGYVIHEDYYPAIKDAIENILNSQVLHHLQTKI